MISPFYNTHNRLIKVHVFKTNIESKNDVMVLQNLLGSNSGIKKWTIDLEDIDNVLRIEANRKLSESQIISDITSKGFYCEVLD